MMTTDTTRLFLRLILFTLIAVTARAQDRFSGEFSTTLLRTGQAFTQNTIDGGRGTATCRGDLFADAVLTDNIYFHGGLRMEQNQSIHPELLEIELTDLTPLGLTLEAGEIDIPLGNLGSRRFAFTNPFYSLPLLNEHLTSVRASSHSLWPIDARYTAGGDGIRLLDGGLYDAGVKVSASAGIFGLSAAVINGSVSQSSTYTGSGLSPDPHPGTVVRLTLTPFTGLTAGGSWAQGYVATGTTNTYGTNSGSTAGAFREEVISGDCSYAVDHLSLAGQFLFSRWEVAGHLGDDLKSWGYSVEGSYTIMPRLSLSARAGGITSNEITAAIVDNYGYTYYYTDHWDAPVRRYEASVRYHLSRESLLKLIYSRTITEDQKPDPVDQLIGIQLAVRI